MSQTRRHQINNSEISSFLQSLLNTARNSGYSGEKFSRELSEAFFDLGMIRTWYRERPEGWELRSGIWSPYYIDLRPTCSYEDSDLILAMIGMAFGKKIEEKNKLREEPYRINKVLGIASAGVPISTAITAFAKIPSCWTRKLEDIMSVEDLEKKIGKYGQHALVEGNIRDGDVFAMVDDVITRAGSKLVAKTQLEYEIKRRERLEKRLNVSCNDVIVLIDREQGGENALKEHGINLYSIMNFSQCLEWLKEKMEPEEHKIIKAYHLDFKPFQDKDKQKELTELAIANSPYLTQLV